MLIIKCKRFYILLNKKKYNKFRETKKIFFLKNMERDIITYYKKIQQNLYKI